MFITCFVSYNFRKRIGQMFEQELNTKKNLNFDSKQMVDEEKEQI